MKVSAFPFWCCLVLTLMASSCLSEGREEKDSSAGKNSKVTNETETERPATDPESENEADGIEATSRAMTQTTSEQPPLHTTTSTTASSTETSTTKASSTETSTTKASSTEASSTEASPTEASSTEASPTEASSTEASFEGKVEVGGDESDSTEKGPPAHSTESESPAESEKDLNSTEVAETNICKEADEGASNCTYPTDGSAWYKSNVQTGDAECSQDSECDPGSLCVPIIVSKILPHGNNRQHYCKVLHFGKDEDGSEDEEVTGPDEDTKEAASADPLDCSHGSATCPPSYFCAEVPSHGQRCLQKIPFTGNSLSSPDRVNFIGEVE